MTGTYHTPKIHVDTSEVDDLIFGVLVQACGGLIEGDMIDNCCLSAYEEACDYLTANGYMTTQNGRLYKLTKKGKKVFL